MEIFLTQLLFIPVLKSIFILTKTVITKKALRVAIFNKKKTNEKENFIFQSNFISELQYFGFNTLLPLSSEIYLKKKTKLILQLSRKYITRNNNKKLQYLQKYLQKCAHYEQ